DGGWGGRMDRSPRRRRAEPGSAARRGRRDGAAAQAARGGDGAAQRARARDPRRTPTARRAADPRRFEPAVSRLARAHPTTRSARRRQAEKGNARRRQHARPAGRSRRRLGFGLRPSLRASKTGQSLPQSDPELLSHQAVKRLIPKDLSVTAMVATEFSSLSLPDSREVGRGGGAASALRRIGADQRGKPEAEAAI